MEEKVKETQQLPEAPASATVKIKSPNGFEYLFTMRDEKASTLMFKMKAMEDKWKGLGYEPLAQNTSFKRETPTKRCTIHNVDMREKTSKTTGKKYFSHWQGTYPNLGDQCFGEGFQGQKKVTNYTDDVNQDISPEDF